MNPLNQAMEAVDGWPPPGGTAIGPALLRLVLTTKPDGN